MKKICLVPCVVRRWNVLAALAFAGRVAAGRGVVLARCHCVDRRVPRPRALVQQVPRHQDDAGARAVDRASRGGDGLA